MTHQHDLHGASHHQEIEARPYFSEQQWAEFHRDDIQSGKSVIILVSGIFSIGVFLYTIIAIIVGSS